MKANNLFEDYVREDPGWYNRLFVSEDKLCKFYYESDKKKYDDNVKEVTDAYSLPLKLSVLDEETL